MAHMAFPLTRAEGVHFATLQKGYLKPVGALALM
jgi:hypothetical protein